MSRIYIYTDICGYLYIFLISIYITDIREYLQKKVFFKIN